MPAESKLGDICARVNDGPFQIEPIPSVRDFTFC